MADSQQKGSRMSDAERTVRKNRTIAKSNKRAQRYEARHQANLAELEALGGKIQTKMVPRWVHSTEKRGNKTVQVVKEVLVEKNESPSEALARVKRSK